MNLFTHKIVSFVVLLFLLHLNLSAKILEKNYTFTYKGAQESFLEDHYVLQVEGLSTHGEVGAPDLPMKRVSLLIPEGYKVTGVTAVGNPQRKRETYQIVPAQRAIAISEKNVSRKIDRRGDLYSSSELYPPKLIQQEKCFSFRGYTILTALLYPVQYRASSGEVYFYENLSLQVALEKSQSHRGDLYRGFDEDRAAVALMVQNPEEVSSYTARRQVRNQIDGIILTNSTMKSAYEDLAAFKKTRGFDLEVVMISSVLSQSSGKDKAEKVRNYITKQYKERGISYVILGGDVSVIPHRILFNNSTLEDYMKMFPCDLYFGGLDGDWDANGNGYYGEFHKDSSDYFAEVFMGRLSTETLNEAVGVVNKIKKFESTPRPELVFLQSSMMDDTNSSRDVKEGNEYTDSVGCHYYVPDNYTVNTLYQEDGQNSNQNYIKGWNSGALMLNHCGHGLERSYSIARKGDHFGNSDASALVNDVYPIHATISCLTGSFDWETDDCIAEKLLLNPNGGVVSTVQNSRNGLYSYGNALKHSGELDIELYRQIFQQQVPTLGQAVQFARQEFANQAWYRSSYNQVVYVWNLIGDPTLRVLEEVDPVKLELLYPAKNDTLPVNKEVTIRWNSFGADKSEWKVDISYCNKGIFGPWKSIATAAENSGQHSWTTPDSLSDKCYIQLIAKKSDVEKAKVVSKRLSLQSGVFVASETKALDQPLHYRVTSNAISVSLKEAIGTQTITLLDVRGRVLQTEEFENSKSIVFNKVQSGVYFLSFLRNEKHEVVKVVVP